MAKIASLVVKLGALFFILALPQSYAIQLQLLGGIWIIQTLPAVLMGLYTRWLHPWALLLGWAAGIAAGTAMAASLDFKGSIYRAAPLRHGDPVLRGAVVAGAERGRRRGAEPRLQPGRADTRARHDADGGLYVIEAQPKRPVMYSSVLRFVGEVKTFSVSPNSINSPRNMKAV